jgi:cytochrome c-type biogenesis protein CcsB
MDFFSDYQFSIIACTMLFFSMISYWISLAFPSSKKKLGLSQFFLLFSNLLFLLTLSSRWILNKYFPLSNIYESLIFLAWSISTIQLYLELKLKNPLIGSLITPLIFFLTAFSSLTLPIDMQKASPLVPSLQSNWLMMHVSMMMISYATLLFGSLLSIFYLIFEFLNEKLFKNKLSLTFLTLIDSFSFRIIGLGFPFLTLGIISGAVWANEAWGSYWSWDPKETWAFITWLVFANYLHARLLKKWQGKNVSIIGTIGFFTIWICYLGVNFLAKGLHSYGWVSN